MLIGITLLVSGCSCYNPPTTAIVEYRQVTVVPVAETVVYDPNVPIDVTSTVIDFY